MTTRYDLNHVTRIDDILEMLDMMVDMTQLEVEHRAFTTSTGTQQRSVVLRTIAGLGHIVVRQEEGIAYPHLNIDVYDHRGRMHSSAREVTIPDMAVAYMLAGIIEGWIS